MRNMILYQYNYLLECWTEVIFGKFSPRVWIELDIYFCLGYFVIHKLDQEYGFLG